MANQESNTNRPVLLPPNTRMDASKYIEMLEDCLGDDSNIYSLRSTSNFENVPGAQRQLGRHPGAE